MIQILVLVNDLQNHWAIRHRASRRNWKGLVFSLLEMLIKGFVNNGDSVKHGRTFCGATTLIIEKYGLQHICDIDRGGSSEDVKTVQAFLADC